MVRSWNLYLAVATAAMSNVVIAQLGVMEGLGQGMSPRYFHNNNLGSPAQLLKRDTFCTTGSHGCQDVGSTSACCSDDKYCYVNSAGAVGCCAIGSNCDNPCPADSYQCTQTKTISGTATATASCCPRPCTASLAFECPNGTGCCTLGFSCAANGQCVSTAAPTSSAKVNAIPVGCTASTQIACAASLNGGCCDIGQTCSGVSFCVVGTSTAGALRTGAPNGVDITPRKSGGLSTGAKAGIGAGVGVVAAVALCAGLWFCMRKRKGTRRSALSQSDVTESSEPTGMSQTSRGNGRRGRGAGSGSQGGAGYFGPRAQAGPYTEYESPSATTPLRSVPLSPDAPGDIMGAVEIGSGREADKSSGTSPGEYEQETVVDRERRLNSDVKPVPETSEHRIELP